jgi:hypothetical protein
MPSSIPYDHPSLVLGNIVDPAVLTLLKKINQCQVKIDAAQDKLQSFILMKRSIAMTINELRDMDVDTSGLTDQQPEIDRSISQSASGYLTARMENETQIQQLREQLSNLQLNDTVESPIDFTRSTLTTLPLSAESLKLDSQYFSYESNQDAALAQIEKYIRDSTSNMGSRSGEMAGTVSSQVRQQLQNHSVSGTLIITASCTHNFVRMFEPVIIDVDKAITAWNNQHANAPIKPDSLTQTAEPTSDQAEDKNSISLITGAGYGSSFIGMVHLLQSEQSSLTPSDELQKQLNEKLRLGGWLENASGGFGINTTMINEVKTILNSQSVSAHVSMVVMGSIPSIASNQLKYGIKKAAEFDPGILPLISGQDNEFETVDSDAEKAKMGAQVLTLQNAKLKNMLDSLGNLDRDANKMLDINSMMAAFENYLTAIKNKEENVGVPVSFNLKKITRSQIEQWWQEKYYPRKPNNSSTSEVNA